MERIICFDTETTGFNYRDGDKIIEVGAIEIVDGTITGRNFHEYVNPEGRDIPPDSYKIHKLSSEFLQDKPKFRDVAPRFLEFAEGSLVVAHNGVGFDFPFINFQLEQIGLPAIPKERQADTMLMAQRRIADVRSYSLDALAKYFGISLDERSEGHGALIDTKILAQIYLELIKVEEGKTIEEIIADQHQAFLDAPRSDGTFPRRFFPAPACEAAAHGEWMAMIVKKR